ncbi:M20/M25/M40 family metallo-hydrolase [Hahella ganghwensis]|uniref:M20/M25/M40 family metallo-hydrolase n=1 Tax=Hahella ganghwensis TaxID=286420 RepID=UPI00037F4E7D|nr:M20/M25/M40 family metallo-hydrolase [Hahella ganghwensis]
MDHADCVIDILEKLISFPTISSSSNLDLINYIANYLSNFGVTATLIKNEEGTKANLLASIGDLSRPGIMLSGHTDVVPVEGQDWESNPFVMDFRNERFYGRGACDMKGFIAVCMAAVPRFIEMDLRSPIHFSFSYDEEIGCQGVGSLIERVLSVGMPLKACIVGEPTSMRPISAHKGKRVYRCQVVTRPFHSSMSPKSINAIECASMVILKIKSIINKAQSDALKGSPF